MGSRSALPLFVVVALAALFAMTYAASARQRATAQPRVEPAQPLPASTFVPPQPKPVHRVRGIHPIAGGGGYVQPLAAHNGRVLARAGASTEFGGQRVLSVAARHGAWLG